MRLENSLPLLRRHGGWEPVVGRHKLLVDFLCGAATVGWDWAKMVVVRWRYTGGRGGGERGGVIGDGGAM